MEPLLSYAPACKSAVFMADEGVIDMDDGGLLYCGAFPCDMSKADGARVALMPSND